VTRQRRCFVIFRFCEVGRFSANKKARQRGLYGASCRKLFGQARTPQQANSLYDGAPATSEQSRHSTRDMPIFFPRKPVEDGHVSFKPHIEIPLSIDRVAR